MNHREPILEARNLSKTYVQRRPLTRRKFVVEAFAEVNLSIHPQTTFAIVGESGAGKSALARCLAFLEEPTQGEIRYAGSGALAAKNQMPSIRRQVQLILQDPASSLNPRFAAWEIIAEPLAVQGIGTDARRRDKAVDWMQQVGLPPEWQLKRPLEFSGGQRQRLAVARALILQPAVLILDEALSNLDVANQEMILGLLGDLQASRSLTYIHIAHDLGLVSQIADEVAVMQRGRIVEHGRTAELFACPEHPHTKELLSAVLSLEPAL